MSESNAPRRWFRRFAVVCALCGTVVGGLGIAGHVRAQAWSKALKSPDARQRLSALQKIGREREVLATGAVRKALGAEQDRELLEAAGYAAMRLEDFEALPILQQRAGSGPDDYARAKLIIYTCRVSQRDWRLLDWALAGARSAEPWRHVGACIGLLELGRPEGGDLLLKSAKALPADVQSFALTEFQRVAEPMFQAVGQLAQWPDKENIAPPTWEAFAPIWARSATPELLADVLQRLECPDPEWHEVNRLLHARKRVAKWLS